MNSMHILPLDLMPKHWCKLSQSSVSSDAKPTKYCQSPASSGWPFALSHSSTSRFPPLTAAYKIRPFQSHPLRRSHCRTSRWPASAAALHDVRSHGQPWHRNHLSTSRWPPSAAAWH
eukprot:scaffold130663_cov37-Prasinocladus_malaysianus.AAC.1